METQISDDALIALVESSGHNFGPPPGRAAAARSSTTTGISSLKSGGSKKKPANGVLNHRLLSDSIPNISGVKIVLKNITIDVEQHAKIAILGRNGSGKR